MTAPFGRRNPRPVYNALLALPTPSKFKPKIKLKPETDKALYAYFGSAIAVLILGAVACYS